MSKRLAREIVEFLQANPDCPSWERLPAEILERSARMSDAAALEVALDLWFRGEHLIMWAGATLLTQHPTAFRLLRWRVLEQMGEAMDHWGKVDTVAFLAGRAWQAGQCAVRQIAGPPAIAPQAPSRALRPWRQSGR